MIATLPYITRVVYCLVLLPLCDENRNIILRTKYPGMLSLCCPDVPIINVGFSRKKVTTRAARV